MTEGNLFETGGGLKILTQIGSEAADLPAAERILQPGTMIGSYCIIERVGRGGMGAVYRAVRRHADFEQEVALKIIKSSDISRDDLLARFKHEQRILANLDALGVSRMLDGGVSEDGRPYIVMEFIHGMPLHEYCQQQSLDAAARLRQLVRLCRIIAHCHRRLVIHGDIKSNNILIDTDGEVRLLDFGIAELLGASDSTDTGELVSTAMTLSVCSPEQALGKPITTESDIYQLGLLIYSMLSGTSPHRVDADSAPSSWATQVASRLLPSLDEHVHTAGTRNPAWPNGFGDLNRIAEKATARKPEDRYSGADLLADDIVSYLEHRPISIRQHDSVYRVRKLIQRNRLASLIASGLALGLVIALVAYIHQINVSRAGAELAALKAQRTSEFITGLFDISDPANHLGEAISAKQLLDRGADELERLKQSDLLNYAELKLALVARYIDLGEHAAGLELIDATLPLIDSQFELQHLKAEALSHKAWLLFGLREPGQALPFAEQAIALYSQSGGVSRHHLNLSLAYIYNELDRSEDAIQLSRQSLDELGAVVADDSHIAERLGFHIVLASSYRDTGIYQASYDNYLIAHDIALERYGTNHPRYAQALFGMAVALDGLGQYREALEIGEQSYQLTKTIYGNNALVTARTASSLAAFFTKSGHYEKAINHLQEAYQASIHMQAGPGQLGSILHNTGYAYQLAGQFEKARQTYLQAFELITSAVGPDAVWTANMHGNIGEVLVELGEYDQAQQRFEQSLEIKQQQLPDDSSSLAWPYYGLGLVDLQRGQLESSAAYLNRALQRLQTTMGSDHPETAFPLTALGRLFNAHQEYVQAQVYLEKALELRQHLPPHAGMLQKTRNALLQALAGQGKHDEVAALQAAWVQAQQADNEQLSNSL